MRKRNYVQTTLESYINESQTINLKRGYRGKPGVNVGANAPLRDRILTFVSESKSVTTKELRKFIAGLNEGSKRPIASANMWIKRNKKFFVTESKNGREVCKLSTIGIRLANRLSAMNEMREDDHDFVDTKKGYARPGLNDSDSGDSTRWSGRGREAAMRDEENQDWERHAEENEDHWSEANESKVENKSESRLERLESVLENFDRDTLNEDDDDKKKLVGTKSTMTFEDGEEDGEAEVDSDDELSFSDLDLGDEEDDDGELGGDDELTLDDEGDDSDVDEKVEISEFIITVDNAADAIAELKALGVDAEAVESEGDEMDGELEGELEGEEDFDSELDLGDEGGDDEMDLDLGDEGEGDEMDLDLGENAEIGANMTEDGGGDLDDRLTAVENKVRNLQNDDISEAGDDDLDLDLDLDDEAPEDELDLGEEPSEEGDELEMDDEMETEETEEFGTEEIRVSAEDFPGLKGWLEDKGVDVEDVLGGDVEVEGEGDDDDLEVADDEDADLDSGDLGDEGDDDDELDVEAEADDDEE